MDSFDKAYVWAMAIIIIGLIGLPTTCAISEKYLENQRMQICANSCLSSGRSFSEFDSDKNICKCGEKLNK